MEPLIGAGLASDLMDYVQSLDMGYRIGENYVAGQWPLDVRGLDGMLLSSVILTQFEEPSSLTQGGRRVHQDRTFRFVVKDLNPQAAVERAWLLYQAIWNSRQWDSPRFHILVARGMKTPTTMYRGDDGRALADFVFATIAFNR